MKKITSFFLVMLITTWVTTTYAIDRTPTILITTPVIEFNKELDQARYESEFLKDYYISSKDPQPNKWLIGSEILYYKGSLYNKENELIYKCKNSTKNSKFLGYSEYYSGEETLETGFLVFKNSSRIYLLIIDYINNQFEEKLLADDAVKASEKFKFERNDRFKEIYNEDALMQYRTVIYRNTSNKLVQIDITFDGIKATVLKPLGDTFLFRNLSGPCLIDRYALETIKNLQEQLSSVPTICRRDGIIWKYAPELLM